MSNEPLYNILLWVQMRGCAQKMKSQAIRKIHDDTLLTILISFCLDSNKKQFFHPLKWKRSLQFHNLRNEHFTRKLEVKEGEIRYIVVICRENQMFDSRNNIVWRYKHASFSLNWNVYASKSAYLFLKKPTLPVFPKIRVSRKRQKCRFCQANPVFCFLFDLSNLYFRREAVP